MKKLTSKDAKPKLAAKAVAAAAPVASKSAVAAKAAPAVKSASKAKVAEVTKAKAPAKVPAAKAATKAPAAKVPSVKEVPVSSLPSTTLIAQVDVGFGNTLSVRGEGGGLSWDKGVAMDNVTADQWTLVLPKTTTPVVFKFLVNDERWSIGDDYVAVPGSTSTQVPVF